MTSAGDIDIELIAAAAGDKDRVTADDISNK